MRTLKKVNLMLLILALALLMAVGALTAAAWYERQPKFHDVTVELGTPSIGIDLFLTEYGNVRKAVFLSDVSTLDIGRVGQTPLTLQQSTCVQTVMLRVVDTTPPTAKFRDTVTVRPDYVPDPMDFISSMEDLDTPEASFAAPVTLSEDLSDTRCTVVVKDPSGNSVSHDCTIHVEWIRPEVTLELGDTLTAADVLYCPELTERFLPQGALEEVSGSFAGQYRITPQGTASTDICTVTVTDTTGPALELRNVQALLNQEKTLEDFVVSATDLSGEVTLELLTEIDTSAYGRQEVTVRATDIYGNVTEKTATLAVAKDLNPPQISGASEALTVEKHSSPDFLEGVTAVDPEDGQVEVTCDAGAVDLDTAGTYYVTYTASDSYFNTRTVKRKVQVAHDQEDTDALVKEIADTLENDPEKIRDFVRNKVGYSHSWGSTDPVWYGFKNWIGNCYVHAACLHALLQAKGMNSQIIGTTCKTHYWVIVEIEDGVWRHIDATPSEPHTKYSLMTDQQRIWTLGGRKWDTTQFPACE